MEAERALLLWECAAPTCKLRTFDLGSGSGKRVQTVHNSDSKIMNLTELNLLNLSNFTCQSSNLATASSARLKSPLSPLGLQSTLTSTFTFIRWLLLEEP
ncbi:hypothetical protein Y1Q_0023721 [Alligator mississippiensis]|uniref:Uncharacterized protein n=1 Tax=Alligator mississippiensis TaxID=8496 RepID=A0A151MKC0_ALLMI|nr:hypothetical protein Y1Q_0023721 [Alligator mississippiensis]